MVIPPICQQFSFQVEIQTDSKHSSPIECVIISGTEQNEFAKFQSKTVQLSVLRSHLQLLPDRKKTESLHLFILPENRNCKADKLLTSVLGGPKFYIGYEV